ncbi:hypothetical protein CHS0354_021463, partial [Potamilus streckersoni]
MENALKPLCTGSGTISFIATQKPPIFVIINEDFLDDSFLRKSEKNILRCWKMLPDWSFSLDARGKKRLEEAGHQARGLHKNKRECMGMFEWLSKSRFLIAE